MQIKTLTRDKDVYEQNDQVDQTKLLKCNLEYKHLEVNLETTVKGHKVFFLN